ncbi:MAG: NAD(P)-dependent oxidoreductase [Pyrinomonadaceae bacterium MAG19_C2-C3]|nr:NAD(P)-dependent oxidoreductase [Pyrinomonadaceae bacterium MAG19_C2-C3]
MKVAITGASGFVGNRVVEKFFLENLHEVVPVVHSFSSLALPARFNMTWKVADHFSEQALSHAFDGCEVVVHAAFGSPLSAMSKAVYRAADKAGARRLVVLSSASVYNQNVLPGTTEDSPLPAKPATSYNANKIAADKLIRDLRAKGKTEVVFLMPSVVFGARSQWVAGVANQLLQGTAFLINDGAGICNTIYIDNLVEAVRLCLSATDVDGEAFFVSDNETVTWKEFHNPILAAMGATTEDLHLLYNPVLAGETPRELMRLRLQGMVETKTVKRIKPHVPEKFMKVYRLLQTPLKERRGEPDMWMPPPVKRPQVNLDMGLLQQCTYKLPNAKAERFLNYHPPVSFIEGMQRSIAWLKFAGYPVVS